MRCEHCHNETKIPLCYGSYAPHNYLYLSEEEQIDRCELNDDLCVIDSEQFYVRGRIEIPIVDNVDVFSWDVWVSLSEKNFSRTLELWELEGREKEEPYFGWLSTELSIYPSTLNLKTNVHTCLVGVIPNIKLEHGEHPLALEQRNGITMDRVKEIYEMLCCDHK
jgi:hypothetical protein